MWRRHWKLSADPFPEAGTPFVKTAGHSEALARLLDTVDNGRRFAVLRGVKGVGKSVVIRRFMAEAKRPDRRLARVAGPIDGDELFAGLARGLGTRMDGSPGRAPAWKALTDAVRLCRWQKLAVVLVVDDADALSAPDELRRLTHLDSHPATRLSVIVSERENAEDDRSVFSESWDLAIRITSLLRSESLRYIAEKLGAAGRREPAFTPRALNRLHELSGGVPRGLDHLATLSLMAGALRGSEIITPEIVDEVSEGRRDGLGGVAGVVRGELRC